MTPRLNWKTAQIRYRRILLLLLFALVPIGLASKGYRGLLSTWVNDFSGDILYEAFWIILIHYLAISCGWRRLSLGQIAIAVFVLTCGLEVLQLWQPPVLQAIRATFLGRTLLGTTFSLWDFPHYGLGCGLTWLGLRYLSRKFSPAQVDGS